MEQVGGGFVLVVSGTGDLGDTWYHYHLPGSIE